jgi:hypothetical protein
MIDVIAYCRQSSFIVEVLFMTWNVLQRYFASSNGWLRRRLLLTLVGVASLLEFPGIP